MANLPPFINSVGLIPKILTRMAEAQQPARFTVDFLGTKLGYSSGSARPVIPLLKRLGMLNGDGTPTPLYSQFRNPSERGSAMAAALRNAYSQIFERNEYAHELPREKFRDLILEITGLPKGNSMVNAIVGTFYALKDFADFETSPRLDRQPAEVKSPSLVLPADDSGFNRMRAREPVQDGSDVSMNLSYTINLNLPESTNPEVFNAIFKALREHLLRK